MSHPVDSNTWKHIDDMYKDFLVEPQNMSYSFQAIMCVVYNLLPNLCMKPQLTMLTLLIEGLRQPRKDIDIYLQPLLRSCKSYDIKG